MLDVSGLFGCLLFNNKLHFLDETACVFQKACQKQE